MGDDVLGQLKASDHDLLIKLHTKFDSFTEAFNRCQTKCDDDIEKHNKEIYSLHAWKNRIVGGIGVIGFVVSGILAVMLI